VTVRRRIAVVTTSRADYGIYRPLLRRMAAEPRVELALLVGGSHLVREHGNTVAAIEADGFRIDERVDLLLASDEPEGIALSMALAIQGFARAYARLKPDFVVVLGDRFEMHAAAVACSPFPIGLVHLHGGELTVGAIDDAWRHSITKLAHLHFVATEAYAKRVAQMGEEEWRIHTVGALGLDDLDPAPPASDRGALEQRLDLDLSTPPVMVTLHPETRRDGGTGLAAALLDCLADLDRPIVITAPNADAGNRALRRALAEFAAGRARVRLVESLGTTFYFGLMRCAAAMVGNSSSGILEAPSFALPVVNIGSRQEGRVRGANVIDCAGDRSAIAAALARALDPAFKRSLVGGANPYRARDLAAPRIVEALLAAPSGQQLLVKRFVDRPAAS
jgi:UDP-hydrolysing UDP-N-acetyl-D-glucosamine 2-epimerase